MLLYLAQRASFSSVTLARCARSRLFSRTSRVYYLLQISSSSRGLSWGSLLRAGRRGCGGDIMGIGQRGWKISLCACCQDIFNQVQMLDNNYLVQTLFHNIYIHYRPTHSHCLLLSSPPSCPTLSRSRNPPQSAINPIKSGPAEDILVVVALKAEQSGAVGDGEGGSARVGGVGIGGVAQELIEQYKYIKIMSGKSKKTTADKTVYNQKQTKYISHSATKMVNRLSLSFYAENTLKMQKQVIMDAYDDFQTNSPLGRDCIKPASLSRGKLTKPKTPIVRVVKQQYQHQLSTNKPIKVISKPAQSTGEKKVVKNIRERSSSRSSRGKNGNSVLFNYISNRMEGCAKGWSGLRPGQSRPNPTKKL